MNLCPAPLLWLLFFASAWGGFILGVWSEHRRAAKSRREMQARFDAAQERHMAKSDAYGRNAYRIGYKHGREGLESVL